MTKIRKAAIGWSAICLVWLIFVSTRAQYDKGAIVREVIVVWIVGLVVIAFIWFVTRGGPARAAQPAVSAAVAPPVPDASLPPAGWYEDSTRPGHKRWWDGAVWGIKDDEHPPAASEAPPADA